MTKSKSKKLSKLAKKVATISDETLEKVITLYLEYCDLKFKIRFTKYTMSKDKDEDFEKDNKIYHWEAQLLKIDKLLFSHDQ